MVVLHGSIKQQECWLGLPCTRPKKYSISCDCTSRPCYIIMSRIRLFKGKMAESARNK